MWFNTEQANDSNQTDSSGIEGPNLLIGSDKERQDRSNSDTKTLLYEVSVLNRRKSLSGSCRNRHKMVKKNPAARSLICGGVREEKQWFETKVAGRIMKLVERSSFKSVTEKGKPKRVQSD